MDTKQEEKEWGICKFLSENPMIYFSLTAMIYGYIFYDLYEKFTVFFILRIGGFLSAYKGQLVAYILVDVAWKFVTQGCGKIKKSIFKMSQEQQENAIRILHKVENVCDTIGVILLIWIAVSVYIRIGEFDFYYTVTSERGLLLIEGVTIIIDCYIEYIGKKREVQEEPEQGVDRNVNDDE